MKYHIALRKNITLWYLHRSSPYFAISVLEAKNLSKYLCPTSPEVRFYQFHERILANLIKISQTLQKKNDFWKPLSIQESNENAIHYANFRRQMGSWRTKNPQTIHKSRIYNESDNQWNAHVCKSIFETFGFPTVHCLGRLVKGKKILSHYTIQYPNKENFLWNYNEKMANHALFQYRKGLAKWSYYGRCSWETFLLVNFNPKAYIKGIENDSYRMGKSTFCWDFWKRKKIGNTKIIFIIKTSLKKGKL